MIIITTEEAVVITTTTTRGTVVVVVIISINRLEISAVDLARLAMMERPLIILIPLIISIIIMACLTTIMDFITVAAVVQVLLLLPLVSHLIRSQMTQTSKQTDSW